MNAAECESISQKRPPPDPQTYNGLGRRQPNQGQNVRFPHSATLAQRAVRGDLLTVAGGAA